MNEYQFQQVVRRMEKRYGKMKRGEEDRYAMLLYPMESNLLKVHRQNPEANSRRLEEAISLVLHEIESRLLGEDRDVVQYENRGNTLLKEALLQAFDPFTNEEIYTVLKEDGIIDPEIQEDLATYYKEPVICVLRIKDSVEHWVKRSGSDGYFKFLEEWLGNKVAGDNQMDYSICVGTEKKWENF